MPAVEVSELSPRPLTNSSQARILADARDVFNHGSTLNSVAGDVHYHNCSHGQTDPEVARLAESGPTPQITELLPSQLYTQLLLKKGRGYPLMDPAPPNELPAEYQSYGVMIGDVGIVSEEGYFDSFFNICEPADGSINGGMVPEGFVTLRKPPDNRYNYRCGRSCKMGGYIVSDPVQVISTPPGASMDYSDEYMYQFQCGSEQGAILALPLGASKEDLLNHKEFLDYAVKHGVRWYEFVTQTLGRVVDNGSICLITGFDKTCSWGTASFPASSALAKSPMHFSKAGWSSYGPATVKEGQILGVSGTLPQNQCIFLRGYRVTLGTGILSRVFGISLVEATPMGDSVPLQRDRLNRFTLLNVGNGFATILGNMIRNNSTSLNSAAGIDQPTLTPITSPMSSEIYPSNLVNLYLLSKFPESDLAVTHDSVWCSYLTMKPESMRQNQTLAQFFEYIDTTYSIIQEYGAIYLADSPRENKFDSARPRSHGDIEIFSNAKPAPGWEGVSLVGMDLVSLNPPQREPVPPQYGPVRTPRHRLRVSPYAIRPSQPKRQLPDELSVFPLGEGHSHSAESIVTTPEGKVDEGGRITLIALGADILLTTSKLAAGWLLHSDCLLSDARHSINYLIYDFIVFFCWKLSRRLPTNSHSYGLYEFIRFTFVPLFHIGAVLDVHFNPENPFLDVHFIPESPYFSDESPYYSDERPWLLRSTSSSSLPFIFKSEMVWFASLGLLVNAWLHQITKTIAIKEKSTILLASTMHHQSHVFSNAMTLIAILGTWFLPTWLPAVYLHDPLRFNRVLSLSCALVLALQMQVDHKFNLLGRRNNASHLENSETRGLATD